MVAIFLAAFYLAVELLREPIRGQLPSITDGVHRKGSFTNDVRF